MPFAGGVSPPLPVVSLLFPVSYSQARRSYYLFFNYLFFNYLSSDVFHRKKFSRSDVFSPEIRCLVVTCFTVENWL